MKSIKNKISVTLISFIVLSIFSYFFISMLSKNNTIVFNSENTPKSAEQILNNGLRESPSFNKTYSELSSDEKSLFKDFCEKSVSLLKAVDKNKFSKDRFISEARKILLPYKDLAKRKIHGDLYFGISVNVKEKLDNGEWMYYPLTVMYSCSSRYEFGIVVLTDIFTYTMAKDADDYISKIYENNVESKGFLSSLSDEEQKQLYSFCEQVVELRDKVDQGQFNRVSYYNAVLDLLEPYEDLAKKFLDANLDVFTLNINIRSYEKTQLLAIGYTYNENGQISIETMFMDDVQS